MNALFEALKAGVNRSFSASLQVNSSVLLNPSSVSGLFVGLPVFGAGVPDGATLASLSPLTLSLPATANTANAILTTGFVYSSRRVKKFTADLPAPALFLRSQEEEPKYDEMYQELTMKAEIFIVSNAGADPDAVPETALNNFLDAIQQAMKPDEPSFTRYTIGGLVHWCRINGKIDKDTNDLGTQAIAAADVEIIVP
jgi:hypothetical protein